MTSGDDAAADADGHVVILTRASLGRKDAVRTIWEHASSRLGLLTSASEGAPNNVLAVEWISHVQFTPPLLMVSLVDGFHSASMVSQSGQFGLCFASDRQWELISAVGTVSGASSDKFADVPTLHVDSVCGRGSVRKGVEEPHAAWLPPRGNISLRRRS